MYKKVLSLCVITILFTGCTTNKSTIETPQPTTQDTNIEVQEESNTEEQLIEPEIETKEEDNDTLSASALNTLYSSLIATENNKRITYTSDYIGDCIVEKANDNTLYSFTRKNILNENEYTYSIYYEGNEYLGIYNTETSDVVWVLAENSINTQQNDNSKNKTTFFTISDVPTFSDKTLKNATIQDVAQNLITYAISVSDNNNNTYTYTVILNTNDNKIKQISDNAITYTYEDISEISIPMEALSAFSVDYACLDEITTIGLSKGSEYIMQTYGNIDNQDAQMY